MVIYCVAYGCKNEQDKKGIPFHRFPFKRPEILKLWIEALRRKDWTPSKTSRLCGKHFLTTDYLVKPGLKSTFLKPDAVPSVFSFPQHLLPKTAIPRRTTQKQDASIISVKAEPMDIDFDLPSTSTSSNIKMFVDRETQTVTDKMFVDRETQTVTDTIVPVLRRKVKTLKQKVQRRDVKISNMKELVNEISKSGHSNENLDAVLKNYFEGLPLELVLLQKQKDDGINSGQRRYSPLMKQFAHTLYFYSPKAYQFLRQNFVLPNGRTIRKWLSSLNCEPGILSEVLEFLRKEVISKPYMANCALIVDGMSIRKQVLWDNTEGRFSGNVDYGGIIDVDHEMPASEALFLQIVSYTNNFKCPVAYFLTNKADANLQTQLITTCLRILFDIGITIHSVTSDGAQANISTYNKLGCNMVYKELVPFFPHPSKSTIKVHCMLDICHMLKLARNALAEKNLCSNSGQISWEYIKALDKIQNLEKLKLANSLSSHHVNYKNKVMNVRLAAQTLSSGVADAIEYLEKCESSDFRGSSATVEFIRTIDRIFDILNSRNPYGKGFKAPIRPNTLKYIEDVFSDTRQYLESLAIEGVPLLGHIRKTFALGFILTMESTLGLAKDLFALRDNPLNYFLTYKCSQDHLEIFFSCIRSRGGWNNNPNTQQLKWALRQLLYRNSITSSVSANCSDLESYCSPAFEFRSEGRQNQDVSEKREEKDEISNYIKCLEDKNLSDFQENVLYYISGYIVRRLVNQSTCHHCIEILLNRCGTHHDHLYSASSQHMKKFTNVVTRGGLIYPSDVVYKIVNFTERQFRFMLEREEILKGKKNIKKLMINTVIRKFSSEIYIFVPRHPVTEEFISEECHEMQLIRKIVELFLKCRMHHHSRSLNQELQGNAATIRQKMTKLVLFKNC